MQTIVVLITEQRSGHPLGDRQSLRERIENAAKGYGTARPATREKSTAPFWTWFIENPRRRPAL